MEERAGEAEFGRRHGVVLWDFELGFEVRAVVEGGGVQHYECDLPDEEVVIFYLDRGLVLLVRGMERRESVTCACTQFSFCNSLSSLMSMRSAIFLSSADMMGIT